MFISCFSISSHCLPASPNWSNVVLAHSLRRWPNILTIFWAVSSCKLPSSRLWIDPMLVQCWPTVFDAVPTLNQHCIRSFQVLFWCWAIVYDAGPASKQHCASGFPLCPPPSPRPSESMPSSHINFNHRAYSASARANSILLAQRKLLEFDFWRELCQELRTDPAVPGF